MNFVGKAFHVPCEIMMMMMININDSREENEKRNAIIRVGCLSRTKKFHKNVDGLRSAESCARYKSTAITEGEKGRGTCDHVLPTKPPSDKPPAS